MELGAPAALWLLALVPVVLMAHQWRPQARAFVATRHFWTAAAPAGVSLSRAWRRDWLPLLLQILVLVAIVGALARPSFVTGADRVAVVIDLSLSMGTRHDGVSRLDEAKAALRELLARRRAGTHVELTGAHVEPAPIASGVAADLEPALDALRPTDVVADLETAVLHARRDAPSAVYVFTDRAAPDVTGAGVSWITVGRAADNVAVTALTATRGEAAGVWHTFLTVVNHGTSAVEVPIAIDIDGVEASRAVIDLPAGASSTRVFPIDAAPGMVRARLDRRDALEADNTRALVLPPPGPMRVQVTAAAGVVRQALAAHPEVQIVDAEPGARGEAPDVIVCDGCDALPPGRAGVLLLPPRGQAPPAIAPMVATGLEHPVIDALTIDGLTAAQLPSARAVDEGAVLARAAGAPAIAAYETRGRRVVELRLDPDAAGFALEPAFPILVANALEWLDVRRAHPLTIEAGVPIRLPVPDGAGVPIVLGPDDRPVPSVVVDGTLTVAHTQYAGIYRMRQQERETTVVVNPAAAGDSDRSLPIVREATVDATSPEPIHRRDAAGVLLLAAVAALFAEWRVRAGERL